MSDRLFDPILINNIKVELPKDQGTPTTLFGAIMNGLKTNPGFSTPATAVAIETHVRDFLAQKFGALMLSQNEEQANETHEFFKKIVSQEAA